MSASRTDGTDEFATVTAALLSSHRAAERALGRGIRIQELSGAL